MNFKQKSCFLTLLLALASYASATLHITFDLGGVLVHTNKRAAFSHIGFGTVCKLGLTNLSKLFYFKSYMQEELLMGFLYSLDGNFQHILAQDEKRTLDEQGKELPLIMCAWLKGSMSTDEIKKIIVHAIETSNKAAHEKAFLVKTITMMFTPELYIKTRHIDPAMRALLFELSAWKDVKLSINSAWDKESFPLLTAEDPELFKLFENRIFISGNTRLLKPNAQTYQQILKQLECTPHDQINIDDLTWNILTARLLGTHGIRYHTTDATADCTDVESLRAQLQHLHAAYLQRTKTLVPSLATRSSHDQCHAISTF